MLAVATLLTHWGGSPKWPEPPAFWYSRTAQGVLIALVLALVVQRVLRNVLKVRVKDPAHMHTLYVLTRNAIFVAGIVVVLFIWLDSASNLTVAMGILGAGIAFASQEVIGSFAGYVNIITGNLYR